MHKRQTFYDSLKFILIAFVVIGHVLENYIGENDVVKSIYYFIYVFHMPLFVYISGHFHKRFDWNSTKKSAFKILETYLLFHLLWVVIKGEFTLKAILEPSWTLWYLLSLIFWRILASYLVPKVNSKLLFSLSFCLSITYLLIAKFDGDILSITRTVVFFPIYLLGIYTTHEQILIIRRQPKILSVIIIIGSFFLVCSNYFIDFPQLKYLLWGKRVSHC